MTNIGFTYDTATMMVIGNHKGDEDIDFSVTPPYFDPAFVFVPGYSAPNPPFHHSVDMSGPEPSFTLEVPTVEADPLAVAREDAKEKIDNRASVLRSEIGSAGYGQESVYLEKAAEARAYTAVMDAGGTPVDAEYPFLLAEVGITAPDIAGVADIVNSMASAWRATVPQIEAARLKGKQDVDAALSQDAISAVIAAIEWPLISE